MSQIVLLYDPVDDHRTEVSMAMTKTPREVVGDEKRMSGVDTHRRRRLGDRAAFTITAAAHAIFLRPLEGLFINAGTLVLGIWGIRAIRVPGNPAYVTAVDLALSVVIIVLLGGITIRALFFFHDRGELDLLRRRRRE